MKKLLIILFVSLISLGINAQENQMTRASNIEIHIGNKVYKGPEISYRGGRVHLAIGDGNSGTTGYEIDKISRIISPMPNGVRSMWNAFLMGKFALVAKHGGKIMEEQRFLGWGKRACFAYGYSLVKEGKHKEAGPILSRAFGYVRGGEDKLDNQLINLGIAAAELANNKSNAAKSQIKKVVKDLEPQAKALYYNIEGDLFAKAGDENQAVLSYYKALLLDNANPYERAYAKTKIQGVYKKLKDPRAEQIKNLDQR